MSEWQLNIWKAFRSAVVWYLKHGNLCLEKENIVNKERRKTAETDTALENKPESKMLNLGRFCIASNVLFYGLGSCAWSQTGRCGE